MHRAMDIRIRTRIGRLVRMAMDGDTIRNIRRARMHVAILMDTGRVRATGPIQIQTITKVGVAAAAFGRLRRRGIDSPRRRCRVA